MYCICEDLTGVNTMQNWATTRISVVKTGKTADGSERQHPGEEGLEPPTCIFCKGETKIATEKSSELYPLGSLKRGLNENSNL